MIDVCSQPCCTQASLCLLIVICFLKTWQEWEGKFQKFFRQTREEKMGNQTKEERGCVFFFLSWIYNDIGFIIFFNDIQQPNLNWARV